jgi:hypothetical protein
MDSAATTKEGSMNTIQNWLNSAAQWVANNSTDTVYIAAILAGVVVLTSGKRR